MLRILKLLWVCVFYGQIIFAAETDVPDAIFVGTLSVKRIEVAQGLGTRIFFTEYQQQKAERAAKLYSIITDMMKFPLKVGDIIEVYGNTVKPVEDAVSDEVEFKTLFVDKQLSIEQQNFFFIKIAEDRIQKNTLGLWIFSKRFPPNIDHIAPLLKLHHPSTDYMFF